MCPAVCRGQSSGHCNIAPFFSKWSERVDYNDSTRQRSQLSNKFFLCLTQDWWLFERIQKFLYSTSKNNNRNKILKIFPYIFIDFWHCECFELLAPERWKSLSQGCLCSFCQMCMGGFTLCIVLNCMRLLI